MVLASLEVKRQLMMVPGLVALCLVSADVPLQCVLVWIASLETGSGQYAELYLGHVQPAAMLGSVMELQTFGDAPGPQPPERSRRGTPFDVCSSCPAPVESPEHQDMPRPPASASDGRSSCMVRRGVTATWRQPRPGLAGQEQVPRSRSQVLVVLTHGPPGVSPGWAA